MMGEQDKPWEPFARGLLGAAIACGLLFYLAAFVWAITA